MAVSASSEPAIPGDGKGEIKKKSKKKNKTDRDAIDGLPSPPRRNKDPGVRVVHGRVYDSEHGRTCHQCRQKTRDFAAACKNVKENDKICPINFCHKCLLNRYGENAEEVMEVEDWKCPKCRGICNCSFCMKKRGQQPTGILVHTAKATGFSSVSELLQQRGPDELGILKVAVASEKSSVSKMEHGKSKRKVGKENHNRVEKVSDQKTSDESVKETHLKKRKRECGTGIDDEHHENGELVKKKHRKKKSDRVSKEVAIEVEEEKCMGIANTDTIIEAKPQLEPKSPNLKKHVAKQSDLIFDEVVTKVGEKGVTIAETDNTAKAEPQLDPKVPWLKKNVIRSCTRIVDMNVVLPPQCIGLTTLVGVDLPTDDIGSALQFLEFCRAFEKALHIRKGLPESVLREIVSGRRVGRRGRKGSSSILQVHIKLLRHIQKANGQDTLKSSGNSWIKALGKCITDAEYPPKDVPMDFLEGGAAGYDKLDSSMKLRILNFLCDETLGTQDLRNWIDEENSKFDEIKKEANARVLEAKKKEKLMKQMLKNEVAQTMISLRDGASLSINEHEALMSKVRSETEKALAEKLETINSVPKMKQRADAVRTEPVVLDDNGRAFWRLRGYSDGSYVMLQDVGDRESVIPQDKWFIYDEEHAKLIEQYISFLRKQRLAMHKVSLSSALQDDGMEE